MFHDIYIKYRNKSTYFAYFNILNLSGILEMWMAGVWLEEGENTT